VMAKEIIDATLLDEHVLTENSDAARALCDQNLFGTITKTNRVQLSLIETLYLVERKKIRLLDRRNREVSADLLIKKASRLETNFFVRYTVFADLRDRGYIVKTALKFGADFRVYDRGTKPGQKHARWVVFPVHENTKMKWSDFSGKNRVAHSTKKKLLIGVVDDEGEVSFWESTWKRP